MFDKPETPALPVPPQMAVALPMFGGQPKQKKPKAKSQTPTSLPSEGTSPANAGGKTLIGQ